MRYAVWVLFISAVALHVPPAYAQAGDADAQAVRQVINAAYVEGLFVQRDTAAVRAGFHPSFILSVHSDDQLIAASLDMWLDRLQLDGVPSGDTVVAEFDRVDITDHTALVKLQLWINGHHTYTDYLGLYRFKDGWKIVNKVYTAHN